MTPEQRRVDTEVILGALDRIIDLCEKAKLSTEGGATIRVRSYLAMIAINAQVITERCVSIEEQQRIDPPTDAGPKRR